MGKEITVDDRRQERDHLEIDYSGPQLPTTTQKIIVKMEFGENSRKPEDQEVERGIRGGNRNLKGWLSHRL